MLSDPLALAARAGSAAATVKRKVSRAQSQSSHTHTDAVNVIPIHIPQHAAQQLRKLMPKVSRPSWFGALLELFVCVALCVSSILLFHYAPWFLVPLGWIVAGGALSAAHCIGRDCAYGCYTPSRVFNRIVGELVFLPLSQPFELFRIKHVPIASTHNSLATFMEELNKQQQTETETETESESETESRSASTKPISRSPSGTALAVTPAPLPVVDGLSVFFSENANARSPSSVNKTQVVTSTTLGIVFLLLTVIAIVSQAGVRGLFLYWLAPMIACRLMFATWQALTLHVISMLPHEVSVTIASYHMLHLALSISHSIDSQLMDVRSVISYYLHRIDPVNTFIIFGVPSIALIGFFTTPLTWPTLIWSMVFYFMSGTGITAGYHRLWAHRAYKASRAVEIYLMLCGSAALEGSIKWWCGGHRVHHRYTDTPKDPYNAQGGFWYAHLGWMLVKPDPKNRAYADIHDLRSDRLIEFQHKYYLLVGPFMAFVFPTLVAGLGWGDWMGGYFYAGAARLCLVHHSTFCVNSVAHYFGAHTYDDDRSPRDHIITALLTFGEGYHNFHHEFPNDYRNGIRWYDWDPTKWLINFFHSFGQTYNLKMFPSNEIAKGQTLMIEKNIQKQIQQLETKKQSIIYPGPIHELPSYTFQQFQQQCKQQGTAWIVINDIIHDVTDFIADHPGGVTFIQSAVGQDATERFLGKTGIYKHSHAAHNLLDNMRVGRIIPAETETPSSSSTNQE